MSSGIPPSSEANALWPDDLPARILGEVVELSINDTPHLSPRQLTDTLSFDDILDVDERWELAGKEEKAAVSALFDVRLADVATSPDLPRVVFWQGEEGLVKTTLVRCNETVSLACNVSLDSHGTPLDVVTALWGGGDEVIAEFLDENSVTPEGEIETEPVADPRTERLEELLEALPTHRSARLARLAIIGLVVGSMLEAVSSPTTGRYREVEADWSDGPDNGNRITMPTRTSKGKRTDVTRPRPGSVRNDRILSVALQRNYPLRQPKPHNGTKRGKRVQF